MLPTLRLKKGLRGRFSRLKREQDQLLMRKFPARRSREFFCPSREFYRGSREFCAWVDPTLLGEVERGDSRSHPLGETRTGRFGGTAGRVSRSLINSPQFAGVSRFKCGTCGLCRRLKVAI